MNSFKSRDIAMQQTRVIIFLPLLFQHRLTHLERNGEHKNSEDESPKRPVAKHLQGKTWRRLTAT